MIIKVGMLQGKFFFHCPEGTEIKSYYPDMKFEMVYKKFGYEITYDMTRSKREK